MQLSWIDQCFDFSLQKRSSQTSLKKEIISLRAIFNMEEHSRLFLGCNNSSSAASYSCFVFLQFALVNSEDALYCGNRFLANPSVVVAAEAGVVSLGGVPRSEEASDVLTVALN